MTRGAVRLDRAALSDHVLEAYRIFYPAAEGRDVLAAIAASVEADQAIVAPLLGRRIRSGTVFAVHPERTGIFAMDASTPRTFAITFLRFYGLHQYRAATRLWPGGADPTADATWVRSGAWREEPTKRPQSTWDDPGGDGAMYAATGRSLGKISGFQAGTTVADVLRRLDTAFEQGDAAERSEGLWIVKLRDRLGQDPEFVRVSREASSLVARLLTPKIAG